MAAVLLWGNSGEVVLVANTAKSILQIKAAANQRVKVLQIFLFGKQPAGGTDTPVKVRLTRNSASFGTFTAVTFAKNDPSDAETIQTTGGSNASVEPTTPTDAGKWYELPPQTGFIELVTPGQELKIPGGQSIQVECTSTGTPTVLATFLIEE